MEQSLRRADALALALRAALERTSIPLARACAAFASGEAWVPFGYARLEDHARERFRRSGRWVRDLAALGDALVRLPRLLEALTGADGGRPLGRVAALLLGRCASPASLEAWLARARASTVRELREAVRRARSAGSEWPVGAAGASPPPDTDLPGATDDRSQRAGTEDMTDAGAGGEALRGNEWTAGARGDEVAEPERVLVRVPVPAPVLAAFDEAVDLYRAVEGRETTVTSFIEALLAEASAGDDAIRASAFPDADRVPLRRSRTLAAIEGALARSTARWRHLPHSPEPSWALALAGTSLTRLEAIARSAGSGGPADLDRQIRELAALEDEMEARLGRLLAEMAERGAWPLLRFASVGHYAEERLGLSRTAGEDRARLARALRPLPLVRDAYERGRIGAAVAGLLARLLDGGPVDRAEERRWLARAEEATVKRMRDEARALGRARLVGPDEVPPAAGQGARASATADRPPGGTREQRPGGQVAPPLDDEAWHASLHRIAGTATRRIDRWCASLVPSDDQPLPGPDVFLRLRLPEDLAARFLAAIEAARGLLARQAEEDPWDEPWAEPSGRASALVARTFSRRSRRVPAWTGLLWLLEDFVATWDADQGGPRRRGETIYARDGWRCTAPGCTSRRHLEDHHLTYRSRLGSDDEANRTCLCRFHHERGEHGGLASCRGAAPLDIIWRLGKPAVAAWYLNERRLATPPRDVPGAGDGRPAAPDPGCAGPG